jgi:hypothetical protein
LVQVSEILVVRLVRQNLVLGFVGQSLAYNLMEYINIVVSLSIESSVIGGPEMISYSLVVE